MGEEGCVRMRANGSGSNRATHLSSRGQAMRDPPCAGEESRALLGLSGRPGGSIAVEGQAGTRAEAMWRWRGAM